jgi:hypothetical protein
MMMTLVDTILTMQVGEAEISKIKGEWSYLQLDGDNIAWTSEQCDQIYQVLKLRQEMIEKEKQQ